MKYLDFLSGKYIFHNSSQKLWTNKASSFSSIVLATYIDIV